MPAKFVVVLGSLMSGLGKGIVTSSVLKILDFYGYDALPIKFDGYLNYDCGTMNPYRHGEVFVLDDKSEVDMDFGMYQRFINKNLSGDLSITGGKIFSHIINKERQGDYLGEDVQIIPHLTNEIIARVKGIAQNKKVDVLVIEVGGTIGDIENSYFVEAMRQLSLQEKVVFINLTYVPKINVVGEQKTKPAQLGFRLLMQNGIKPDFIVCRLNDPLDEKTKEKLSMFTNTKINRIIDDSDAYSIYQMPLHFIDQGFDKELISELGLNGNTLDVKKFNEWKNAVNRITDPRHTANIAIVGKYTELRDSYVSVKESVVHAGAAADTKVNITWVESSDLEKPGELKRLEAMDGIIVPGGFGKRGIEGMVNAIQYAREHKVPYLGLCLGMQLMAVEFARNVCGLQGANSTEFDKDAKEKVIYLLPSQKGVRKKGGTMRLGAWKCKLPDKDTIAYKSYGRPLIEERHRHRYEFNNKYLDIVKQNGLKISGVTADGSLVEFIEWGHGFGIGTQAHPELKSTLAEPAPLFVSFIEAAKKLSEKRT